MIGGDCRGGGGARDAFATFDNARFTPVYKVCFHN